jgi:tetratricopeptide (TPR) repeat protein
VSLDAGNAFFVNYRGMLYQKKGDYKKALSDFNRAIELVPDHQAFHDNRANLVDAQAR